MVDIKSYDNKIKMAKVFTQKHILDTIADLIYADDIDIDYLKECIDALSDEDMESFRYYEKLHYSGSILMVLIIRVIYFIPTIRTDPKYIDIVKYFLAKENIGINVLDEEGCNILYYIGTISESDKEIFNMILQRKDLDFSIINDNFDNMISYCLKFGEYYILNLLLQDHRANVTDKHLDILNKADRNNDDIVICINTCINRIN